MVAQLDRVTDYESVGRGFESLLAHQKRTRSCVSVFLSLGLAEDSFDERLVIGLRFFSNGVPAGVHDEF